MGNFQEDLKTAEIGENKTVEFLNSLDCTYKVIDVREDKFHQEHDVDYIYIMKDCEYRKIEVKTDTIAHISGNIVYEHTSNKHYNTKGCFEKTKSDLMFYYLSETDELYYINVDDLKEYVNKNKNNLKEVFMGDNALGYLLRINKLLELGIMFKVE